MSNIAVVGAGAWGTAISIALARQNRHNVSLWAFEKEVRDSIAQRGVNEMFLPDQAIPPSVRVSNDFAEVLREVQIVVSVMPSHHTRRVFQSMAPHLKQDTIFVSATKGVEDDSLLRMSEV